LSIEYGVHDTFNVIDLSPFVGTNEEDDALDLRTNPFPEGGGMMEEGQAPLQLKAHHLFILGQSLGSWLESLKRIGTLLLMAERPVSTCSKMPNS